MLILWSTRIFVHLVIIFYVYFLAGFEHGSLRIYFFHRSRFCPALIGGNVDDIFSENRVRWWDLN